MGIEVAGVPAGCGGGGGVTGTPCEPNAPAGKTLMLIRWPSGPYKTGGAAGGGRAASENREKPAKLSHICQLN